MAEHMTVELEQLEVKEETVSIQEEILPSSTVEDKCTVYKQEEDAKMEFKKIKGKHLKLILICAIRKFSFKSIYFKLNFWLFS